MFYIESNGYAATSWLARSISSLSALKCFHGSRAIPEGLPLGSELDLNERDFIAKLSSIEHDGDGVCVGAIHAKFPIEINSVIKEFGGHYSIAIRNPVSRIVSCASWAKNKFEKKEFFTIDKESLALAYQYCSSPLTWDDILFSYAIFHVVSYDVWTYSNKDQFDAIFQMERYTTEPEYFVAMIQEVTKNQITLNENEVDSIFSNGPTNSHSGNANKDIAEVFSELTDNQKRMIQGLFAVNSHLKGVYAELGYNMI